MRNQSVPQGTAVRSIHADKLQIIPGPGEQSIEVPLLVGGDRHPVRQAVKQIQLLNADLVDLVQHIQRRYVDAGRRNDRSETKLSAQVTDCPQSRR
jgi:hypothetical protein